MEAICHYRRSAAVRYAVGLLPKYHNVIRKAPWVKLTPDKEVFCKTEEFALEIPCLLRYKTKPPEEERKHSFSGGIFFVKFQTCGLK